MFNTAEATQDNGIIILQFNSDNFDTADDNFDETDTEYIFLTKSLGRKKGLNKEKEGPNEKKDQTQDATMNDVTKLANYLFLTEQTGWCKGLKLFWEKGEETVEKELHQIHDMEGFHPKHKYELAKEEQTKALKYLIYLKE